MPVQKFKTFEEASQALWNFNPDEQYYRQVRNLYKMYSKLSKFKYPHGVFKFKTFEEAEAHKLNAQLESAKYPLK